MSPQNQKFDIRAFSELSNTLRTWWQATLPSRVMVVAVVMIVGALIAAVTAQPDAPLWRRGAVVGALSILLALNLVPS
ncbi:MAG: sensor histidine kinase, partial [Roseiflexaceae bacterium]|nr:sensor histidine kinase [Roseiflexaceae bacterium]